MMNLKSRIDQLERKAPEAQHVTAVHRVLIDTPEQLHHPERFTKKLIHTNQGRSCTRYYFELERNLKTRLHRIERAQIRTAPTITTAAIHPARLNMN